MTLPINDIGGLTASEVRELDNAVRETVMGEIRALSGRID